ncbi:MAG TPA: DUF4147 domain-containing protein [Thermoplasmata archaeon]|nr:DUF4147 domain-containing protein [Thermoplasmata archaeon]
MTLASDARTIARAGIAAVEPGAAVASALRRTPSGARVGRQLLPIPRGGSVSVVAIGKAATKMAESAHRILGRSARGIAVIPPVGRAPRGPFEVYRGGHPTPTQRSVRAAESVLTFLARGAGRPVVFLISGGGSALCESPAAGIALDDLQRCNTLLLDAGTPIQGINTVRRHLSRVKGGQLAAAVAPATSATLAISDVIGDTPWDIASGPTVPDPTTFADAVRVAKRWNIWGKLPGSVRARLNHGVLGTVPENPKPGDPRLRGHRFQLVASNRMAVEAATRSATAIGYRAYRLQDPQVGDTQRVARAQCRLLIRLARTGRPVRPPACVVSGGETTVRLGSGSGRGGRNQEFALTAAIALAGRASLLALSVGTDGVDGPTDAAGGWADGRSAARATQRGIDLADALAHHRSYDTLRRLGTLWKTGPTGTNVTDLHVLLAGRPARVSRGRAGSSRPSGVRANRRRPS